ncbi:MAG: glycoside hydrolase family 99-like domain-containing protein [Betaproteobacteria bacterium]
MKIHHHLLAAAYYPIRLANDLGRHCGALSRNELRVLLYHDIAPHNKIKFSEQLKWLARTWNFVSPERFSSMLSGEEPILGRNLLLTFDDGFISNRVIAEEVLSALGIRALFFVISDFVGIEDRVAARQFISKHIYPDTNPHILPNHWQNMRWTDLEALMEQGHSVGSHTKTHARLPLLEDRDLQEEIVGSGDAIAHMLGAPVDHFAYTFGDIGSFNPKAMAIAKRRYKFIYSGLRGFNDAGVSQYAVRRDASALQDSANNYSVFSNHLLGALLEGTADRHYASSRRSLDQWTDSSGAAPTEKRARVIAFYLPQFHPVPENDLWWGKGFTEWTNVVQARVLFEGHEQPHLPADLGFYDLRLHETRMEQAEMAAQFGIEGFCYWHYWFAGRRMLERPFSEVLASGKPDFPFCLGWANHSWTGIWKDEPDRMLIDQTYPGEADDRAHFACLLEAFRDHRYITVDGKPMLVIFKPTDIPKSKQCFDLWRELAIKAGLKGLYIVGINMQDFKNPTELGLDAVTMSTLAVVNTSNALLNEASRLVWGVRRKLSLGGPRVLEYSEAIKHLVPDLNQFDCEAYPCVFPRWDNTPRKGRKGLVLENSTPELFEQHLQEAVSAVSDRADEHKIVFLKSWNEWAEGNYLEPDMKWGLQYLQALKRVVGKVSSKT